MKKQLLIRENVSMKDALKLLNETSERVLFIVDDTNHLLGAISDGDVRRFLLKGHNLDTDISSFYNKRPVSVTRKTQRSLIKKLFIDLKVTVLPVVNDHNEIIDFFFWKDVFSEDGYPQMGQGNLDIPLVIMCGGKGTRLDPFTKVFPKPLMPIGETTVIEKIIKEFQAYGIKDVHLTINYKAEMIEAYFNGTEKNYRIDFYREKDFYGTAGSLTLLKKNISKTFFVSNCDIIVKANYCEVYESHMQNRADLTLISSIQHHQIPYGVVEFKENGLVSKITEKPEYTMIINTGVYLFNKEILDFIPEDTLFDMNMLIDKLMANGRKVYTYPVNENDYVDLGQWTSYRQATEKLNSV